MLKLNQNEKTRQFKFGLDGTTNMDFIALHSVG